jgi:very-short-patch-repair endonuclease
LIARLAERQHRAVGRRQLLAAGLRYAFEQDRRRDLDLQLADWHVIRLTWRQIAEQPERVLALLRKRLTAARSER